MEVTPQLLREVEFPEKLRGYHPDHVDEFLEQVAVGVEQLLERLREANERAEATMLQPVVRAPDPVEDDLLRKTLVMAQRAADAAIADAKARSAAIVADAEERSRALLADAEERARAKVSEADKGLRDEVSRLSAMRTELAADLAMLRQEYESQRARAMEVHSEALRWLEDHMPQRRPGEGGGSGPTRSPIGPRAASPGRPGEVEGGEAGIGSTEQPDAESSTMDQRATVDPQGGGRDRAEAVLPGATSGIHSEQPDGVGDARGGPIGVEELASRPWGS
jgi:cell division initiation protein